jgi:CBS domain-containing protein
MSVMRANRQPTWSAIPQPSLAHVRVRDAMHQGIISVHGDAPLRAVARVMAEHHVHAVVVTDPGDRDYPWGIVSAVEVVAAAASGADPAAGEVAATEVLTISSDERLDHAAQLMSEHELSHLIVTDSANGHPSGVLSTLDIAAAYARSLGRDS